MARGVKTFELREADVVDLAHDGRGVARVEGKAVFIRDALAGERVRYRTTKSRRQFDEAETVEVLMPAPQRVAPRCAHFGVCGGCALQHLSSAAQLEAKQGQLLDNLERIGQVAPREVFAPLAGPHWAYRRRARLGVKYVHKKGRVLAGFRERSKPYLADIKRCEVLLEPLAQLPERLAALVGTLALRERVPQVEVAAGDTATALVFRVMDAPNADDLAKLERFGGQYGLQIFLQTGGLETVRPLRDDYAPLNFVVDGDLTLEFGPIDFVQVNAAINAAMIDAAMRLLEPRKHDAVLDLFCGLGNFTLPLARRAHSVLGVEGDAALIAKARSNAARNGVANACFESANLFEPKTFGSWARAHYDGVLLDPPRAGAAELLPCMRQWQPRRIVYISCHPGSLARDAGTLVRELGYALTGAGVMDMFPQTTHVESIAVFEATG
jgi:23S rRNA (uracil1939-C5)-methyltransferase